MPESKAENQLKIEKAKPKKAKTREYLEAAMDEARRLLPGWMFAVIHRAALPSSGGRASRNRRISASEKAWVGGVCGLSDDELGDAMRLLTGVESGRRRKGWGVDAVRARMSTVAKEMGARNINSAVVSVVLHTVNKAPEFLPEGATVEKGFSNGEPEGGMHAHGLDRLNSKTFDDGNHSHLFVLPGTGEVLITDEDGSHAHAIERGGDTIEEGGDATATDGTHSHLVRFSGGDMRTTLLGGMHAHELMVGTSGFGGLHQHTLLLADGTAIRSLSPGEFVDRFVDLKFLHSQPMLSSREIVGALNEARMLRDQVHGPCGEPASLDEVMDEVFDLMAKGEPVPEQPMVVWEVVDIAEDGVWCRLSDVEPILMKSAGGLELEPCDIVEVSSEWEIVRHSPLVEPHSFDEAAAIGGRAVFVATATKSVAFRGPQDAPLVFVSASPSSLEMARKEALVGPDGALFEERYLTPLGLTKNDVAIGFAIPVTCDDPNDAKIDLWRQQLIKSLAFYGRAKVVALGRVAKQALGPIMSFSLPHPAAVRRHGDRGEVDRKIRKVRKELDTLASDHDTFVSSKVDPSDGETGATLADSISEPNDGGSLRVAIIKSLEEKRIVYGVILDPYVVDLQNDWIPPAEIEATAHDFLTKSRVIGLQHKGAADAEIVESWVELYPSEEDRELALKNLPHRVYRRKFGSDTIHSGAWVAGAKLSEPLWALAKNGDLDAFSIGGFSFKTVVSPTVMPEVEFIDLEPSS